MSSEQTRENPEVTSDDLARAIEEMLNSTTRLNKCIFWRTKDLPERHFKDSKLVVIYGLACRRKLAQVLIYPWYVNSWSTPQWETFGPSKTTRDLSDEVASYVARNVDIREFAMLQVPPGTLPQQVWTCLTGEEFQICA